MSQHSIVEQSLPARRIYTVSNFSKRNSAWTESSLRWLIYCSKERHGAKSLTPANGLANAIIRKQGRVLIDELKFFDWLESATPTNGHLLKTDAGA